MSGLIIVPKVLSLILNKQLIRTNKRDDKSMGKGVIGRGWNPQVFVMTQKLLRNPWG